MSKRKNRKQSPNLPQEMLERARQQLHDEQNDVEAPEAAVEAPPVVPEPKVAARPAAAPRSESARPAARSGSSRRRSNLQPVASRGERRSDKLDSSYVRNRLANPTRIVGEEELRAAYGYVTKDLRSMGLLAVALIVAMVVIEKII